jgi:hypothetical protein
MSENYQRREVRSISCSVLPVAASGIILVSRLVAPILRSLSQQAKEVFKEAVVPLASNQLKLIKPLSHLHLEKQAVQAGGRVLSAAETLKLSALLAISKSQCVIENRPDNILHVEALRSAVYLEDAQRALGILIASIKTDHNKIFLKGLTIACTRASVSAGFSSVQTETTDGVMRIVATDHFGRALVTEIHSGRTHEPEMMTEVVGVKDGSCKQIIDVFHQELEAQGITSAPPRRKYTGGVCSMDAAFKFIQRSIKPENKHSGAATDDGGKRRTQHFNQRKSTNQKA